MAAMAELYRAQPDRPVDLLEARSFHMDCPESDDIAD